MLDNSISRSITTNFLGFFSKSGELQVDAIVNFLESSKLELASALGLSYDQIRQATLTGKAYERVLHLATALEYVSETFEGNRDKTLYWIRTPNLNFGGFSPRQLILKGKHKKVLDFILSARTAQIPPK